MAHTLPARRLRARDWSLTKRVWLPSRRMAIAIAGVERR